jgi:hypothetical protein
MTGNSRMFGSKVLVAALFVNLLLIVSYMRRPAFPLTREGSRRWHNQCNGTRASSARRLHDYDRVHRYSRYRFAQNLIRSSGSTF